MMLLYKAWRESRTRFALIGAALAVFCAFAVFSADRLPVGVALVPNVRTAAYSGHIYDLVYSGTAKGMFAMLVIFLGLGGLLRERSRRTALFTLALPTSRPRIVGTQLLVGLGELLALSLLPAVVIPVLSRLLRQSYPVAEALHFSILWFVCGTLVFSSAYFLSVILPGEYTAPVVCYIMLMLQVLLGVWPPLRPHRLNLMWTMGEFGTMHWDPTHTVLLTGSLPWLRLIELALIAAALLAVSTKIAQRQDF